MIEFQGTFSLLPNGIYSFQNAQVLATICALSVPWAEQVTFKGRFPGKGAQEAASGQLFGLRISDRPPLFGHLVQGTSQSQLGQDTLPDGHTHDSI